MARLAPARLDLAVVFPLHLTWEDGSQQSFASLAEIQTDLEDYDSDHNEPPCRFVDAEGIPIRVKVSMTCVQHITRRSPGV